MARLTPFEIGQIKAHAEHDLSAPAIAARVIKSDGQPVGRQAVLDVLARLHADPKWRGERAEGWWAGGCPSDRPTDCFHFLAAFSVQQPVNL